MVISIMWLTYFTKFNIHSKFTKRQKQKSPESLRNRWEVLQPYKEHLGKSTANIILKDEYLRLNAFPLRLGKKQECHLLVGRSGSHL